jgi:hypothetical protein
MSKRRLFWTVGLPAVNRPWSEGWAIPDYKETAMARTIPLTILLCLAVLGCGKSSRVTRSFPADGVKTVVFRASLAKDAQVTTDPAAQAIEVSGVPQGGAAGYHSPDPNWRETPAAEWGLDFVSARYGEMLVISTKNEIHYVHHAYFFRPLTVRMPPGIELIRENRALTGKGAPDLDAPKR